MGDTARAPDGLRALLQRSLRPMLLVDDAGRLVDANHAASLLLRLPRPQILQRRFEDILGPSQRETITFDWDTFLAEGRGRGRMVLSPPSGRPVEVAYEATANVRPGLHLSVLSLDDDGAVRSRRLEEEERRVLTDRERQVLQLLALGMDGPQIATELSISTPTVQTHVRNAMGRLGAHTRAHAVALALTRGEIDL